jgi:hypothetical protein
LNCELLNRCIGKTVCRQSGSDATLHDSRSVNCFAAILCPPTASINLN